MATRPVAEESLALPLSAIADALRRLDEAPAHPSGATLAWKSAGRVVATIGYQVACGPAGRLVRLHYTYREQPTEDAIVVVSTQQPHGGVRWWWQCPACLRRAGVLYNPTGARYWRCRQCYQVTYRSSNESRTFDTLAKRLGFDPAVGRLLQRRAPGRGAR